jgi:hypothetical protein
MSEMSAAQRVMRARIVPRSVIVPSCHRKAWYLALGGPGIADDLAPRAGRETRQTGRRDLIGAWLRPDSAVCSRTPTDDPDGQLGRQPGTMPTIMKGIGLALVLLGSLVALGLGLLVAQSQGVAQGAVTFGVGGVIAYVGFETFSRARDRERGEKLRTNEAARQAAETEAGGLGSTEGRSDS